MDNTLIADVYGDIVRKTIYNRDIIDQVFDITYKTQKKLNLSLYDNQKEIMEKVVDWNTPYLIVIAARGSGKSHAVAAGIALLCLETPNLSVGVFAPKEDQANRLLSQVVLIIKNSPIKDEVDWKKSTLSRLNFKNGSYILCQSAGETTQGEGYHFPVMVLDESQKISDFVWSNRLLPMTGSFIKNKIIKIGVPLYRNHFYQSFTNDLYTKLVYDWMHSPILLNSGKVIVKDNSGVDQVYSKYCLDRCPLSIKTQLFPNNPELHYDGDMTELDFKTQYMVEWVSSLNTLLSEEDQRKLASGTHDCLDMARPGEEYYYGVDFGSGTLIPNKKNLDFTSLSVIRKNGDNSKDKVFQAFWQGNPLDIMDEVEAIVNPENGRFKCRFGLIDYSVVGVVATESFKRKKIPVAGIQFGATEPTTHKNWKNALSDQAHFEIKSERFKYPRIEQVNNNVPMKKAFNEWCSIEREESLGVNAKIEAPSGDHDDAWCLAGDTLIPLVNGERKTIKELSEIDVSNLYTYSYDLNKKIIVSGKIKKAWKTGTKKVIKIVLDNNWYLECTPEHKIMMRDGSYKEAKDLKENDSLMPLYRRIQKGKYDGYVCVRLVEQKQWVGFHRLVSLRENYMDSSKIVHHKDFNKRNNNPDNLPSMSSGEHFTLHNNDFWKKLTPEQRSERNGRHWKEFTREERLEITRPGREASKLSEHPAWNKGKTREEDNRIKESWNKGKTYEEVYGIEEAKEKKENLSKYSTGRKHTKEEKRLIGLGNSFIKSSEIRNFINKYSKEYLLQLYREYKRWSKIAEILKVKSSFLSYIRLKYLNLSKNALNNHKVKMIIDENKTIDVYDMEIEEYHNFALESGIFVHNCSDMLAIYGADKAQSFGKSMSGYKIPRMGIGGVRSAMSTGINRTPSDSLRDRLMQGR